MPYMDTAQQWLTQSTLLLKARPSTTRITSKYTISPPSSTPSKTTPPQSTTATPVPTTTSKPDPPTARATLTLKTYDPQSGTTLKYSTNKGAEVSRLIQILGRLARGMAGLEEREEVVLGEEVKEEGEKDGVVAPVVVKSGGQQGGQQQQQQQGGKGKGKKKGKK
ncbi:signal recognition particle 9 kDa protein-domain-containing protein [Leptodontidium sp. MPI-SDFR-AT-0119]|nr:signal recognition particle 9 kDa protein-domain-containing protein [Leptodontidium sp. MPI-SDFR-AT-0119]